MSSSSIRLAAASAAPKLLRQSSGRRHCLVGGGLHSTTMATTTSTTTTTSGRAMMIPQQQQRCQSSAAPQPNQRKQANVDVSSPTTASFLESSSSFWASLRRQAATALTSSLTREEQTELLEKMGHAVVVDAPKQQQKQDETPRQRLSEQKQDESLEQQQQQQVQKSIEEAVAEARMQEARTQKEKWDKEKDKLLLEAEQAAKKRVENELRIQKFQQWQNDVDKAKGGIASSLDDTKPPPEEAAATDQDVLVKAAAQHAEAHPLLGPTIVDLGYKRVHLASAKQLATIQVWKKQRIYRHNRAKSMAQDKLKTLHLGMPGVIGLHEDQQGKLSIIDGQHRVGMMSILEGKPDAQKNFDLDRVLVEVYPELDGHDDHAGDLFLEVNKAEPVKLVDMPGVATVKDRKIITEAAQKLQSSFPQMFSSSQKCRVPHVNIDNMRDALFAATVLKRHNIKSTTALEAWLLEQNEYMAQKYNNSPEAQESVSKAAWTKATKFSFYLGLDSSWYYN